MTEISIIKPEIKKGINSFRYSWPDLKIAVDVDRVDEDGVAEIKFWHNNGAGPRLLHFSKLNLLSASSCTQVAKRLTSNANLDWNTVLTYVTTLTLESLRQGEPAVPVGKKPEYTEITYQLQPILEKNQPTTIYAPGGSSKSYLAIYIASLVQFGITGMDLSTDKWLPEKGNVLYLDWESTERDMKRRAWFVKQGLGGENDDTFLYRPCSQPLITDLPNIQRLVSDNNIQLIIIDSQMAASGYGPDPAMVASQYYNALRSLGCTSLTLDHVAKADWRMPGLNESVGPYGSVVKYNRSRSQFEIQKKQRPGDDFFKLKLVHRKHNEGKLLDEMGIQVDFTKDELGRLDMVLFGWIDLKTDPDFNNKDNDTEAQIIEVLMDGPLTVKELATALDTKEGNIRTTLARMVKGDKELLFHDLKNKRWELKKKP